MRLNDGIEEEENYYLVGIYYYLVLNGWPPKKTSKQVDYEKYWYKVNHYESYNGKGCLSKFEYLF